VVSANIDLVRSAFDAWNRDGVDTFTGHMSDDVVWLEVSGRPEGPANERHGRERLRSGLDSLFDAWETYRIEVERLEEVDGRVVAVVREVGRGRASGVEVDGRWGYLITVEDGEIVRVEAYRDARRALELAGIG
jgi:ketosteroid isomerase-like protein